MSATGAKWMSPPAIAKQLGVTPEKVTGLIRSGEIAAVDIASKGSRRPRFRVSPEALEVFLDRRRVVPPVPIVRTRRAKQTIMKEYF